LICITGRGIPYVESLIGQSKGDIVLDYLEVDKGLVRNLKAAVEIAGGKVEYAFDAVNDHETYQNVCEVLDHKTGRITLILPGKEYKEIPSTAEKSETTVGATQIHRLAQIPIHGRKRQANKRATKGSPWLSFDTLRAACRRATSKDIRMR